MTAKKEQYKKVVKWKTTDNYGDRLDYFDLILCILIGMIPIINILFLIEFLLNNKNREIYFVKLK